MLATPAETNWPRGTLRSFESTASISAKLAIYNHVGVFHYVREVYSRSLPALARLLREPLYRVRDALERPAWVSEVDALIDKSLIPREAEMRSRSGFTWRAPHRYCSDCMSSFYHSWMHDISWLDHCFVHRATPLTRMPFFNFLTGESPSVRHLHDAWKPALVTYIRTPHAFDGPLARLSNRTLRGAGRALGTMFVPDTSKPGATGSFEGHPMALASLRGTHEESQAAPRISRVALGEAVSATYAGQPAVAAPAGSHTLSASHPVREDDRVTPAIEHAAPGQSPAAGVGRMTHVRAGTRCALACAVACAIRQTTDNVLTRHHGAFQSMRFLGKAKFVSLSKKPNFWTHLAYVLATGGSGAERTLIESLISRLAHGHEHCLSALKACYDREDHLHWGPGAPKESDHVAFHLRGHGVCARLLTFDLLTRMLCSEFLCQTKRKSGVQQPEAPRPEDWMHAGLRPYRLFESNEWNAYERSYDVTLVSPYSSQLTHFTHTLHELEWAFFRRECLGHGSRSIDHVLHEILFDQHLMSVMAQTPGGQGRESEMLYVYFGLDGGATPDWGELARRDPSHAQRTARVLKEIKASDHRPK